jgi:hypothetical protein
MALTLQVQQRLERAQLVEYYEQTSATWLALAKKAYQFVKGNFPQGSTIRPDDVAEALLPLLKVSVNLTNALDERKLKQRYWRSDFCDLIIDRFWETLHDGGGN